MLPEAANYEGTHHCNDSEEPDAREPDTNHFVPPLKRVPIIIHIIHELSILRCLLYEPSYTYQSTATVFEFAFKCDILMDVKIINVLKDDSFEEILELFRRAPGGEVFLVLPKNGKLFRHEDHFAVFASEARQGTKTVSILTPNPDTAVLAKKFGFTVVPSKRTAKTAAVKPKKPEAVLASVPPPADLGIREESDDAYSDVPMTSDATMGNESIDSVANDVDPLHNMHILDEEGHPVDADEDGKTDEPDKDDLVIGDTQADFVAAQGQAVTVSLASTMDGVRGGVPQWTLTPKASPEKAAPVPVQSARELDYIDAVWRDKTGQGPQSVSGHTPKLPSLFSRAFSRGSHAASGPSLPKKIAAGILLAALVVLGSVVYAITGSANVTLAAVGKTLDTPITIQASDTFSSIDDAFLKIPGQLLEVSKTSSNTVTATGTRDIASKARGKITVINEFSSSPQTLVATTRFQSTNGLVYRTLQNITVPGSTVKAGKTVAGSVVVDVIADRPGPDYNIPAGKFTIMAFVEKGDAEKAKRFYGTSGQPISGGASGPSTVVTQADYESAQASAVAGVKEQITTALAAQGPALMVLDGDKPVMKETQSSARVDDAADSVTATATGTLTTVAFRTEDLHELIRTSMLKKDRLMVMPDKLQLSYSDISFKPDLGTLTFTVTVKGTGYMPVDVDAIKRDIGGKNAEEMHAYFTDKEGVLSATVKLSPPWVRRAPQNTAKISVKLLYGQDGQ